MLGWGCPVGLHSLAGRLGCPACQQCTTDPQKHTHAVHTREVHPSINTQRQYTHQEVQVVLAYSRSLGRVTTVMVCSRGHSRERPGGTGQVWV